MTIRKLLQIKILAQSLHTAWQLSYTFTQMNTYTELETVNYNHKALHLGCCISPRSASAYMKSCLDQKLPNMGCNISSRHLSRRANRGGGKGSPGRRFFLCDFFFLCF